MGLHEVKHLTHVFIIHIFVYTVVTGINSAVHDHIDICVYDYKHFKLVYPDILFKMQQYNDNQNN